MVRIGGGYPSQLFIPTRGVIPQVLYTFTSNNSAWPVPLWANYLDVIACGGGGGGVGGAALVGGYGGTGGYWSAVRWTLAQVLAAGSLTITIGTGGGPAGSGGTAGSGTASSVSGTGLTTLSAPGGAGGTGNEISTNIGGFGGAVGNEIFNTFYGVAETYVGGAAQGAAQGNGNFPGGGAAGGDSGTIGSFVGGGSGAAGVVYILAYQ